MSGRKAQDRERDLKLLLDMYKASPKEARDKAQLMTAERKLRVEVEELKSHIKRLQEAERRERRKLAEEDALRKIKKMEETIGDQLKSIAQQKQVSSYLSFCVRSSCLGQVMVHGDFVLTRWPAVVIDDFCCSFYDLAYVL